MNQKILLTVIKNNNFHPVFWNENLSASKRKTDSWDLKMSPGNRTRRENTQMKHERPQTAAECKYELKVGSTSSLSRKSLSVQLWLTPCNARREVSDRCCDWLNWWRARGVTPPQIDGCVVPPVGPRSEPARLHHDHLSNVPPTHLSSCRFSRKETAPKENMSHSSNAPRQQPARHAFLLQTPNCEHFVFLWEGLKAVRSVWCL